MFLSTSVLPVSELLMRVKRGRKICQSNPPSVGMPRPAVFNMLDMVVLSGATPKLTLAVNYHLSSVCQKKLQLCSFMVRKKSKFAFQHGQFSFKLETPHFFLKSRILLRLYVVSCVLLFHNHLIALSLSFTPHLPPSLCRNA